MASTTNATSPQQPFDERDLNGKIAVVTGANRGIGRAVARALAARGATVLAVGRDAPGIEATARELGENVRPFVADMTDIKSIKALSESVKAQHGHVDVSLALRGSAAIRSVLAPQHLPRM